jgi:uncharacterized protein YndB with AHSA1/START domain
MSQADPVGVEVHADADTVSASTVVAASAHDVFEYLRRPANHAALSGDHSVRAPTGGASVLGPGDRFGMGMKVGVPYRISSHVVEFEADRRIAWCHFFGHRWRWELEDLGDGTCRVKETFDLSTARVPAVLRLVGFPAKHRANVASSVANLASHFAASSPPGT